MIRPRGSAWPAERQLGLLWGGVAVLLVCLAPLASQLAGALSSCPLKSVTGLPCPSCGATRAAVALARFDLAESLAANPLASVAWVVLIVGGVGAGAVALAGGAVREPSWAASPPMRWSLISILLANWVYLFAAGV